MNFFNYAVESGMAPENPVAKSKRRLTTLVKGRPTFLLPDELEAMLQRALMQERFDILTWLVLGCFLGLRPLNATVSDGTR